MNAGAVARKDFKGARRSKLFWTVAILLGVIAAVFAYVSPGAGQTPTESVSRLFRNLMQILSILLPLVALMASYMAIAGERESGGIKFLLSLPNTRRDVFAGKLLSRLGIVAGGVGFMYVAAISMALTRHGAFPTSVVFGTLLVTVAYGSVFVSIAVSLSAAVAARSRAIAGAIASYFVLVLLYVIPVVRVPAMVQWVHTTLLGMDENPDLYNAVQYTSPYMAYRKATNLVVPDEMRETLFRDSIRNTGENERLTEAARTDPDLPVYLTDEFSLVVLAFWVVVPLLAGYWLFERSDLE